MISSMDFKMNTKLHHQVIALALFVCIHAGFVHAGEETLPKWELGMGTSVFSLPQYMGSDERYTLPFAYPYVRYRGESWRFDRSGLRNRLFDVKGLSLDMSASGSLPVRNTNLAREGMPELYLAGEIGPKINWLLAESSNDSWKLHAPFRAVVNVKGDYLGWVSDPHLRYHYHDTLEKGVLRLNVDAGVQYGSELYHRNYYTVEPIYAKTDRAEYHAKAGKHSVYLKARIYYPYDKTTTLTASMQARSLASGVVNDSPLVKDSFYGTLSLGAIWTFRTSPEMVTRHID